MVRPTLPPPPLGYLTPADARIWLFKMYEALEFKARSRMFSHIMGIFMLFTLAAVIYLAGSEKWWIPLVVSILAAYFWYEARDDMLRSRKEKEDLVEEDFDE